MNCSKLRDRLIDPGGAPLSGAGEGHLESCAYCRRFAARLDTARRLLRDHRCDTEPDAAFAARVAQRLTDGSAEMLGWAAARLLPATLVLLLVLAWFAVRIDAPSQVADEVSAPTDDLVSWVLDGSGE
jgi:hypothetical protein